MISTQQSSRILGINERSLTSLREKGCLKAIRGPIIDGYPKWMYDIDDVNELLKKVMHKVPSNFNYHGVSKLISFGKVLQKSGNLDFKMGHLVEAILVNDIKPVAFGEGEGLNKLNFLEEEINNYFLGLRSNGEDDYITAREMKGIIGVKRGNISDWMKKGFLKYVIGEAGVYKSTRQEFKKFIKTYMPLSIVAEKLNTNSKSLFVKLQERGISPLTGPLIDGGGQYLYKKNDIDNYLIEIGEPTFDIEV